ncbi:hypothetical protein [Niallia circulans]|uniref:Uncharacterized protein n=1 Tax=Niallia circulans TaxID=1397 RepID=A0A941G8N6_NIACI|nr:hypothetical protein [Niallia circulans]MCB5235482.1 hypothetical protein [Niallia circulans]
MNKYFYVPLQREGIQAEAEIKQAINDLVSRGYELVFGPQCFTKTGKKFVAKEKRRVAFDENVQSNMWRAKMRKEKG